jgi:polyhydroxyalkanoate synthesis repressor PhaR
MGATPSSETPKVVVVKKYANRRLYNTETSTYVTLDDLAAMVRAERDFVVYDAKSNEDLTHSVLTQIILEQENSGGETLLPVNFLRQLIRFYGDSVGKLVPSYLDLSLGMLTREQDKFRKQMTDAWGGRQFPAFGQAPFGTAAVEALHEQSRKNMAMFEQSVQRFWAPFGAPIDGEPVAEAPKPAAAAAAAAPSDRPARGTAGGRAANGQASGQSDAELAAMREQLATLQRQLDRMAGGR